MLWGTQSPRTMSGQEILAPVHIREEKDFEAMAEHVDALPKLEVDSTKLDPHGYPLNPQPSRFRDDPLVRLACRWS